MIRYWDEVHDVDLLHHLRDAWQLVQRFENDDRVLDPGENELRELAIKLARKHFGEVLTEAAKRELSFMECLQ